MGTSAIVSISTYDVIVTSGAVETLLFTYSMKNVLDEKFEMTANFSFYLLDDYFTFYKEISPVIIK